MAYHKHPSQAQLRRIAAQLWRFLYLEPWPATVTIRYSQTVPSDRYAQATPHGMRDGGTIDVSPSICEAPNPVAILVHEFAHVRLGLYRHTRYFAEKVGEWSERVGVEAC